MTEPAAKRVDGGPAFPFPTRTVVDPYDQGMREQLRAANIGMSLRDYFAGQAVKGAIARLAGPDWQKAADVAAESAYMIADAMLKARER